MAASDVPRRKHGKYAVIDMYYSHPDFHLSSVQRHSAQAGEAAHVCEEGRHLPPQSAAWRRGMATFSGKRLGVMVVNILIRIGLSWRVWRGLLPACVSGLALPDRVAGGLRLRGSAGVSPAFMAGFTNAHRLPPGRLEYKLPGFGALPCHAAPRYGMDDWGTGAGAMRKAQFLMTGCGVASVLGKKRLQALIPGIHFAHSR